MRQATFAIPDAGDHVRIVAIHPFSGADRRKYIGKSALVVRDHNTLPRGYAPKDGFGALVLNVEGDLVYFHGVKVELDTTAQEVDMEERMLEDLLDDPS